MQAPLKLISPNEARLMLGISLRHLYDLEAECADFPKKIRLSSRCVRFDEEQIRKWVDSRRYQQPTSQSDLPSPAA